MKYAYTHDFLIFKKEIQKKVFLIYVFINIQSNVIWRIIIHVAFKRYRLISFVPLHYLNRFIYVHNNESEWNTTHF